MAKRKKTAPKKNSNILTKIAWTLTFIAVMLISFISGYYLGYDSAKKESAKKEQIKKSKRASILKKLEDARAKKERSSVNNRLKEVLKKSAKSTTKTVEPSAEYSDASHEYEGEILPKAPVRDVVRVSTKPKLAIIIDDVSVRSHVEAIKSLNLPLTMSFLPPSKYRPNSPALASKEKFYMVHLPMEAKNFTKEEPFTLRVSDSQKDINNRIKMIKKLFPRVKYINNHTGSKFTSNELAVNRLVYALKKQNINFIDSRTIATTKVPVVMKNYGTKYVARDVFLDHKMDKAYIKSQIKRAIKIAKVHGTAIAIGHPHANTLSAINESKKLLKDVDLVLINKLY